MSLLIKELTSEQRNKIIDVIRGAGFEITHNGPLRIEFSKGYRQFTLNSTDTFDLEFGLTTSFDMERFLTEHYKEKPKHAISLKEQLYKKEKQESLNDIESSFKNLGWEVVKFYDFKEFSLESFNEDPLADTLYEVSIRGLSHVVADEEVYEGELSPLLAMARKRPLEIFNDLKLNQIIEEIKKIT